MRNPTQVVATGQVSRYLSAAYELNWLPGLLNTGLETGEG